ncbi:MAG: hypothetical protein IJC17_04890, partial [Clostridia bacterium]|nr:hypothetical protein [Clostridia bacterium]
NPPPATKMKQGIQADVLFRFRYRVFEPPTDGFPEQPLRAPPVADEASRGWRSGRNSPSDSEKANFGHRKSASKRKALARRGSNPPPATKMKQGIQADVLFRFRYRVFEPPTDGFPFKVGLG